MHVEFEQWFKNKSFYYQLVFIHGERLFLRDQQMYRILVVQIAFETWSEFQCKQEA